MPLLRRLVVWLQEDGANDKKAAHVFHKGCGNNEKYFMDCRAALAMTEMSVRYFCYSALHYVIPMLYRIIIGKIIVITPALHYIIPRPI
jgi:hypothetical protein